ncbi:HIT family protein [Pelagibius sp.]|uniref:HIT family protein n=1 Tax=Pelagibius sp. TaxID=1931238 RepID=UPI003B509B57
MTKFGYPETLIREYGHWVVLLRPHQTTLGALVLACKDEARAFSDVTAGAFGELQGVVTDIEAGLNAFRPYKKINYLMLMMVDPDVHFHVLPRYDASQEFAETVYPDAGWPAAPDLSSGPTPDAAALTDLAEALKAVWPRPAD